ncbi:MAG: dephospho-CoA kinase [Pirellulales bacterium]
MKVIGIVGGVASGKSFVAGCLARLGARHLDADRTGHEVLREPEVKAQARHRWGETIFDSKGEIDRKKLAEIVFGDGISARRERIYLEQLVHPRIRQRLESEIEAARAEQRPAVVLDAALLLESDWSTLCDSILFVYAPEALRASRAAERGWTSTDWRRRESSQMPVAEKQAQSQAVIDNAGSAEETERQVRAYWDSLFASDVSN